jgi:hypothetical protein
MHRVRQQLGSSSLCTPLSRAVGICLLCCCAGIAVGAVAVLLLLVMLTSLSLNMCMARTGKIRRQLNWWHKHLAGMPKSGKMAIVVTDIEGYSGALLRTCIKLHSSIYVL